MFDFFKKKQAQPTSENDANEKERAMFEQHREAIIDEFKKRTTLKALFLTTARGAVGLTDSKFGGVPYFPAGMDYPCNPKGEPMRLLAQLNLNELPKLPDFPQRGILQFFIVPGDSMGLDFDNPPHKNTNFRVVYHADVVSGENTELPDFSDTLFPFEGEFKISGAYKEYAMPPSDYRFHEEFMKVYKKHINTTAIKFHELDDDIIESVGDLLCVYGHMMGGYPEFCQEDPRTYVEGYGEHTVLLFQMDSENGGIPRCDEIMWGDAGCANFFITRDALLRLDFSNVLYNWDCH
ncbi:MAG: YwqG family protein [Defluviitaleaceae bacterium]|nr:YwqG family protein [Defluviitaleaceae bacterium]